MKKPVWVAAGLLLLAVAACWAGREPALRWAGGLLVFEKSDFARVDALVVLPGSVPDRVLEAVDLLSQNRADEALLLAGAPGELDGVLSDLGIAVLKDRELNRKVLLAKGIGPERVVDVPGSSRSSREDGLLVRGFLAEHPVGSIAVVTCKYHSRRAYLLFREAFKGTGVEVYSTPSRYCSFDTRQWWRHHSQAKAGVTELVKLAAFWVGVS